MASEGLHESAQLLDEATIDHHRALTSLVEELEAVDWYDQRVKATTDSSLADILAHNRDEEKEHACMTLEWLRRRDPALDRNLRTYLFTTEPVTEVEHETEADARCRRGGVARHRQPEGERVMDHLYRELAPVTEAAWSQIEDEAKGRLVTHLAARKLVDLDGPHGWGHSATDLGRVDEVPGPAEGVAALRRRVLPLVELRADFSVSRQEIDDADRGADDIDLPELDEAVRQLALAENSTVFHGYADAGMLGITECSSHQPIGFSDDMEQYPKVVAHAVDVLRRSGIGGPYGLAIGPEIYTGIVETDEHGGHLLLDHLRKILERAAGLGAGRAGRCRAEPARRRLRARLRPGPVHRLPGPRCRGRAALRRREHQLPGPRARRGGGPDQRRLTRPHVRSTVSPVAPR